MMANKTVFKDHHSRRGKLRLDLTVSSLRLSLKVSAYTSKPRKSTSHQAE